MAVQYHSSVSIAALNNCSCTCAGLCCCCPATGLRITADSTKIFLLSASLPDTHRHSCIGNFNLLLTSAPLLLLLLQMWPLLPLPVVPLSS